MSTQEAVMTTKDVASRFNELAQSGQWDKIQGELFADNAVSIEPANSPGLKSVEGIEAIRKKGKNLTRLWKKCTGVILQSP